MAGSVLLIVVDNPAHRVLFNRHLGNTPHHLVFARDGEDAFDRFVEVKPDLVIAHVNVPRLDGTILCQLIRQQPRGESVPFVLVGEEFARSEIGRERMAVVGADAFLPLPFDRRLLIERITPLLTFGRMEQSSRRIEALPAQEVARRAPTEVVTPPLERAKTVHASDSVLEFSAVVQAIEGEVEGKEEQDTADAPRVPRDEDSGAWMLSPEGILSEPEAPGGPKAALPDSADTVVSFQNPFAEAGLNQRPAIAVDANPAAPRKNALEQEAVTHIELLDRQNAQVDPRLLEARARADDPSLDPSPGGAAGWPGGAAGWPGGPGPREARARAEREPSLDPSPGGAAGWPGGPGPREAARGVRVPVDATLPQDLRPKVDDESTFDEAAQQAQRQRPARITQELRQEPRVSDPRSETPVELRPEGSAGNLREPFLVEPPILDRRERDRLEEPSISGLAPPVPDHSESSQKARLIQEPQRELTPSSSDRGRSPLREAVPAAVRRGLDESQLGKRLAKRVRTMFRLLDEVDYYQILGVDPEATPDVLRRAYFDLSLEFHPDRFFLLRSGDLKEKIYAIYRRITEAHSVLSDERRRRAYDEARSGSHEKRAPPELREEDLRPAPRDDTVATLDVPVANAKAKRFVELARAAMSDGDLNGARLHLVLAQAYEQDNAKLRAAIEQVAEQARP